MECLGLTEKLQHFRKHREEYEKRWKAEEENIFRDALVSNDPVALNAHRHAGADVANTRPQMNADGEMKESCEAASGFSNMVLLERSAINEGEVSLESIVKAFTLGGHEGREEYNMDLDDELPNEFICNDDILYGSFRPLLPLAHITGVMGKGGSVPRGMTRRLMRFYDQRFAQSKNFKNLMLSQKMRHETCEGVSL